MPHNKPDSSAQPTRMTMRAKNATTHPGAILQDTQRTQRPNDEIERDKAVKDSQREAKVQKKAMQAARKAKGEEHIARLRAVEDIAIANAENTFPCHKPKNGLQLSSN